MTNQTNETTSVATLPTPDLASESRADSGASQLNGAASLSAPSISKIRYSTVEEAFYLAADGHETLVIKVRGRGWFFSTGINDEPGLTTRRLKDWILENATEFKPIKIEHFHFVKPQS